MASETFLLIVYVVGFLSVLVVVGLTVETIVSVADYKSSSYKFAHVGCVLKPRKTLKQLIMEIVR